jgi:hypothetical protein
MFPGSGIVCHVSGLTNAINESLVKLEEEEWASSTVEFDRISLPTNGGPIKQFGFKNIFLNTVKKGLYDILIFTIGIKSFAIIGI